MRRDCQDEAGSADTTASVAFLAERETCWRRVQANRGAVLIDAAGYFGALRASFLAAERPIFIRGWELDGRTCLRGRSEPRNGAPREIGKLLR